MYAAKGVPRLPTIIVSKSTWIRESLRWLYLALIAPRRTLFNQRHQIRIGRNCCLRYLINASDSDRTQLLPCRWNQTAVIVQRIPLFSRLYFTLHGSWITPQRPYEESFDMSQTYNADRNEKWLQIQRDRVNAFATILFITIMLLFAPPPYVRLASKAKPQVALACLACWTKPD